MSVLVPLKLEIAIEILERSVGSDGAFDSDVEPGVRLVVGTTVFRSVRPALVTGCRGHDDLFDPPDGFEGSFVDLLDSRRLAIVAIDFEFSKSRVEAIRLGLGLVILFPLPTRNPRLNVAPKLIRLQIKPIILKLLPLVLLTLQVPDVVPEPSGVNFRLCPLGDDRRWISGVFQDGER